MPLNVTIDTYPIEFTFDERDLVDSSTQERYTGFCPVNIEVENPTFPLLYKDANDQLFEQPIEHNGKYKMVPYESEPGSFPVSGYVPKYIADQSTSDYDLFLNIPNEGQPVQPLPPNTCYFDIDTEVIEFVNREEQGEAQGILRLPSNDSALMQKVNFDIGDKDYATEVAIDLSGVQIVEKNIAVLDITPAVLQYVNDRNYQRYGQINLPDGILNALTDFEDNGKGFATDLVINVGSLANLVPRPELNNNTILLQQNGTYQIGNFDNDDADVEIEPSNNQQINPSINNKVLSIRKIENTKDGNEPDNDPPMDEPQDPEDPTDPIEPDPEPETTTNYTIGTFTVNVPQPLITQVSDYQISNNGSFTIPIPSGYDAVDSISGYVNVPQPLITQISNYPISNVGSFNIPIPSGYDAVDSISGNVDVSNKLLNSYTFEPSSLPSTFNIQDYNQANNTDYIGVKEIVCNDTNLQPQQSKIIIDNFSVYNDLKTDLPVLSYMTISHADHFTIDDNDYNYICIYKNDNSYYFYVCFNSSTSSSRNIYNNSNEEMVVKKVARYNPLYFNFKDGINVVNGNKITPTNITSAVYITNDYHFQFNSNYYDLSSFFN